MPKPQKVVRADKSVRWKVRFRDGATNASESFVTEKHARDFCKLIDALGGARARAIINEHKAEEVIGAKTLGEVADLWLAWKSVRDKDGKPLRVDADYTLRRYEQLIRLHIKPGLGHMPINLVGEGDVQQWTDQLAAVRSPKTTADAHSLLHSIYKWANAKAQGYAVVDPCTETALPRKRKNVAKGISPAEWSILYAAAVDRDQDAADLLLFLYASGWRWSEAVALRSVDVDDFGDSMEVSMGRVLRRNADNRFEVVDGAKSTKGLRTIGISKTAADMIRRRRKTLRPHDLIFTNRKGNGWRYSTFHSDLWTFNKGKQDGPNTRPRILQIAHKNGLTRANAVTLHWLRHGHAVIALRASGGDFASVQKRLGHESIATTTGTYGSMIGDVTSNVINAMDEALSGPTQISDVGQDALDR